MADYLSSREQNIPKKYKYEYMYLANHLKILFSNDLELKKFISDELKLNQSDITFEFDFSKSEKAELIIPTIIFYIENYDFAITTSKPVQFLMETYFNNTVKYAFLIFFKLLLDDSKEGFVNVNNMLINDIKKEKDFQIVLAIFSEILDLIINIENKNHFDLKNNLDFINISDKFKKYFISYNGKISKYMYEEYDNVELKNLILEIRENCIEFLVNLNKCLF